MRSATGRSPTCAAAASATLAGTIAYEILLGAAREYARGAGLLRGRHPSLYRSRGGARRRGAAGQHPRGTPPEEGRRVHRSSRRPSPSVTTSACWRRPTRRFGTASTSCCARRCATARSSASSGSWNIWNDDQPELHRRLLAGETVAADHRLDASTNVAAMSRLAGGAALPPVAASGVAGDPRAVVPVDGAGGRPRRADRHRTRLRVAPGPRAR